MGRCGRHDVLARPGGEEHPTGRLVDRGGGDDAADGPTRDDVGRPVRRARRVGVVPRHAGVLVHAVAIEDVVGAVLAADADDLGGRAVHVDREEVRHRAEGEVVVVDLAGPPRPGRRAVRAEGDQRLVVARHRRRRHRGRRVGVGVAVAGAEVQQVPLRVVGGRRPHVAAARRGPVVATARARRRGSQRGGRAAPRCGSRRTAGCASLGIGSAHRTGLDVEVPDQGAGAGVDRVEAALAGGDVVDVHAEVHRVADHERRRLDLVALTAEPAEPRRLAAGVPAPGAGGEAPPLGARGGVERVDVLTRADEHRATAADVGHRHRSCGRERRPRLVLPREPPQLAAVVPVDGVHEPVPRGDEHRPGRAP